MHFFEKLIVKVRILVERSSQQSLSIWQEQWISSRTAHADIVRECPGEPHGFLAVPGAARAFGRRHASSSASAGQIGPRSHCVLGVATSQQSRTRRALIETLAGSGRGLTLVPRRARSDPHARMQS